MVSNYEKKIYQIQTIKLKISNLFNIFFSKYFFYQIFKIHNKNKIQNHIIFFYFFIFFLFFCSKKNIKKVRESFIYLILFSVRITKVIRGEKKIIVL